VGWEKLQLHENKQVVDLLEDASYVGVVLFTCLFARALCLLQADDSIIKLLLEVVWIDAQVHEGSEVLWLCGGLHLRASVLQNEKETQRQREKRREREPDRDRDEVTQRQRRREEEEM
jgi:hypothetical protein